MGGRPSSADSVKGRKEVMGASVSSFGPAGGAGMPEERKFYVADAETGELLILNNRTAMERGMDRSDATDPSGMRNVTDALPRLAGDVYRSSELHSLMEKQRQVLRSAMLEEEIKETDRQRTLQEEFFKWRRKRLKAEFHAERKDALIALERMRFKQESELLHKAKDMGLM